ncbi:MAG TPA: MarR family transcriptional regulator [Balneolales bacterium]|nr:MarR family transcriptional regulator [Balneolales bacterium]
MDEKKPTITKNEYELLSEFRYALRKFLSFSKEEALNVGLTPQQHQALLTIKGSEDLSDSVTIGQLAERLQIHHNSAVGLVDRLVERGLVERSHKEDDRRKVYISLTDKGNELLQKLTEVHKKELKRIGPELNHLIQHITNE